MQNRFFLYILHYYCCYTARGITDHESNVQHTNSLETMIWLTNFVRYASTINRFYNVGCLEYDKPTTIAYLNKCTVYCSQCTLCAHSIFIEFRYIEFNIKHGTISYATKLHWNPLVHLTYSKRAQQSNGQYLGFRMLPSPKTMSKLLYLCWMRQPHTIDIYIHCKKCERFQFTICKRMRELFKSTQFKWALHKWKCNLFEWLVVSGLRLRCTAHACAALYVYYFFIFCVTIAKHSNR